MINKNKYIFSLATNLKNNKFYLSLKKIFKHVSFLKYLFLIFFISISTYLIIPKYFNYEKKEFLIKKAFLEKYNIKLEEISSIKYDFLPRPRLKLEVRNLKIEENLLYGDVKNLCIILDYSELYNIKELKLKKVIIDDSNLNIDIKNISNIYYYLKDKKNKIFIKNSNLILNDGKSYLTSIKKTKLLNNKKDLSLTGSLSNKRLYLNILESEGLIKMVLKIPEIDSYSTITIDKEINFKGSKGRVKAKILNNNFKFDFEYNEKLKIYNSVFRNKNLQSSFDGSIVVLPYFKFDLIFNLKNINFAKLLDSNFIEKTDKILLNNKKLNGKLKVKYKNNAIYFNTLKKFEIILSFKNGEIDIKNILMNFEDLNLNLSGFIAGTDYKKLNFKTFINVRDEKKLLKKMGINKNIDFKPFNLNLNGSMNLEANKIYFNEILSSTGYKATKKEIKYYKENFEKLVIKNSYLGMFDKAKVYDFIKEVY